jgi:hypothetical protein
VWLDHNKDGWPDLYVSNDFWGPDILYQNNGDGTFTNVTLKSLPHTPWFSMGCDIADINNDGHIDLMASDMSSTTHYKQKLSMGDMQGWFLTYSRPLQYMRYALYLNTGAGRFMEVAHMAGVASTDWTWSLKFGDLDNDGWEDLFVSNGASRFWDNSDIMKDARGAQRIDTPELKALWLPQPKRDDPNIAMRNLGGLKFASVGEDWGLADKLVSFGVAYADFDNDGDLDIAMNNFDEKAAIYRNRGNGNKSLTLRLRGTKSNRDGIGARIEAGKRTRYLTMTRGFMSANEPRVHIGVGEVDAVEKVDVWWPSGLRESYANLATGKEHLLTEGGGEVLGAPPEPEPTMFRFSPSLVGAGSAEKQYDDFLREPLLPNSLSRLGPGIAFSDVDGDGLDDFYIARPRDVSGALFFHAGGVKEDGNVDYRMVKSPGFIPAADSEDMAPLFFDADGDGDLDLFVSCGSNEKVSGDASYRDRLYLNDGAGGFLPAEDGALPDLRLSSSVVCAADMDRDGDLDLFVGTRLVPGAYPTAAPSHVLRNDGGKFSAEAVPAGMVTSALWSDADDDGWLDLLVTREWGAVLFYRNEKGKFAAPVAVTEAGWWNSIAGRDLDNDGDVDYVLGNFGLNTKYHDSARIYYGDFDGSGKGQIVEAKVGDGSLLPVRGKSCSQNAMPSLREKFPTFHSFASATLEDIYTEPKLASALMHEVTELRSGVLWNEGSGKFTFAPLPRLAQVAPVFGIALTDVDADGWCDVFLVGNFYGPQAETGRMDGGVGLLLLGKGGREFGPVSPERSGFIVPQDARGVAITDLNDDGRPDFVVTLNAGPVLSYFNQIPGADFMRIEAPVGTKILAGGQCAEISAGGGYLSQSPNSVYFARSEKISTKGRNGEVNTQTVPKNRKSVKISE